MAGRKGLFKPRNIHKYRGDPDKIVFRSSWELKVMNRLDVDPNVVWWSSERVIVPYMDKTSGRTRRYFPDFLYCRKLPGGGTETVMAEVKPAKESPRHAPPPGGRRGQSEARRIQEAVTWGRNKCKWDAAEAYCAARGWKFVVLTERQLGIKS